MHSERPAIKQIYGEIMVRYVKFYLLEISHIWLQFKRFEPLYGSIARKIVGMLLEVRFGQGYRQSEL